MEWSSDDSQVARGRVRSRSAEGRRLEAVATLLIERQLSIEREKEREPEQTGRE